MGGGGERIIPTAVFILTFVAMSAFLISQFNGVLTKGEQNTAGPLPPSPAEQLAADLALTLFNPGTQYTNGTKLKGFGSPLIGCEIFSFTLTGQTDVGVAVFRNFTSNAWSNAFFETLTGNQNLGLAMHDIHNHDGSYRPSDFIIFWQKWMGGTLALDRHIRYNVQTFNEIAAAHGIDNNFTVLQLHLRYWVTGIIGWDRNISMGALQDNLLWNNQFNISIATGFNATYGSLSAGTIINQLLTMKMPNVPIFIQAMIAIPCYLAIIMVAVLVVSYFVP